MIAPMFNNYIDATSDKVGGVVDDPNGELMGGHALIKWLARRLNVILEAAGGRWPSASHRAGSQPLKLRTCGRKTSASFPGSALAAAAMQRKPSVLDEASLDVGVM